MVLDEQHQRFRRPAQARRRTIRRCTAGLAFAVALLYLVLMILVADAERSLGENTYGAYLFLSVPYLGGAVLLARLDNRVVYLAGTVVQLGVIALFVLFGLGAFGPGVFEYEALGQLHMAVWAGVITGAEVVLVGLLAYLALTAPKGAVPAPRGFS